MKGKDLKIIIEELKEYNINLETINKILMLDERLINKINLANNKQELKNIIEIILTKYSSVEDTIVALNIYSDAPTKQMKHNVTEILTNNELIQDDYHIVLAKEYINMPIQYVESFIKEYTIYREISNNVISLEVLKDGIKEIYNAKSDIAECIEEALKIYIYNLASVIEYSNFKEFLSNYKLTNNEVILSKVNIFLSSVKSLEELENLSQIMAMLINSSKVIDNILGESIEYFYYNYSTLKHDLIDIDNKNEILKIILSEKIDKEDIDLILDIARYFKYSKEIVSILRILYEVNYTEKDYEVLNEILNNEKLYDENYNKFLYFISEQRIDLVNRLYNVFHFEYPIVDNKNDKSIKPKKKMDKATRKRNKVLEQYLSLCDEVLNEDINPSKLVRKK